MSGQVIILSGARGAGKTTTCLQLAEGARQHGLDCSGVICPPRFDGSRRVGIDLLDVRGGERRPLAEADSRPAALRTPAYRFHQETMEWGAEIIQVATPCTLLIIDELGPLELVEGRGWTAALDVLTTGRFDLAVAVVRPGLIHRLREQLPGRPVELLMLPAGSGGDPVAAILAQLGAAVK